MSYCILCAADVLESESELGISVSLVARNYFQIFPDQLQRLFAQFPDLATRLLLGSISHLRQASDEVCTQLLTMARSLAKYTNCIGTCLDVLVSEMKASGDARRAKHLLFLLGLLLKDTRASECFLATHFEFLYQGINYFLDPSNVDATEFAEDLIYVLHACLASPDSDRVASSFGPIAIQKLPLLLQMPAHPALALNTLGLLIDLFEHTALRPLYLNEAVSLGLTIGLKSPDEGVRGLALELLGSIAQASAEGAVHLVLANCVEFVVDGLMQETVRNLALSIELLRTLVTQAPGIVRPRLVIGYGAIIEITTQLVHGNNPNRALPILRFCDTCPPFSSTERWAFERGVECFMAATACFSSAESKLIASQTLSTWLSSGVIVCDTLTLPPGAAEYLSGFVVDMLRAYKETNNKEYLCVSTFLTGFVAPQSLSLIREVLQLLTLLGSNCPDDCLHGFIHACSLHMKKLSAIDRYRFTQQVGPEGVFSFLYLARSRSSTLKRAAELLIRDFALAVDGGFSADLSAWDSALATVPTASNELLSWLADRRSSKSRRGALLGILYCSHIAGDPYMVKVAEIFPQFANELGIPGLPPCQLFQLGCVLAAARLPNLELILAETVRVFKLRQLSIFDCFQLPPAMATAGLRPNLPVDFLRVVLAHEASHATISSQFKIFYSNPRCHPVLFAAWVDGLATLSDGTVVLQNIIMDGITQPIYDDTMLKLAWSCLGRLAEANYSVLAHLRPNIMSSLLRVAEAIPDNIKVPFDTSLKVLAGAISIVKACVANGSAHAEELFLFTQTLRWASLAPSELFGSVQTQVVRVAELASSILPQVRMNEVEACCVAYYLGRICTMFGTSWPQVAIGILPCISMLLSMLSAHSDPTNPSCLSRLLDANDIVLFMLSSDELVRRLSLKYAIQYLYHFRTFKIPICDATLLELWNVALRLLDTVVLEDDRAHLTELMRLVTKMAPFRTYTHLISEERVRTRMEFSIRKCSTGDVNDSDINLLSMAVLSTDESIVEFLRSTSLVQVFTAELAFHRPGPATKKLRKILGVIMNRLSLT